MYGVNDRRKASVAAKAPLPGEQALRRRVITQRQIRNTSITEFKSDFCNKIGQVQTWEPPTFHLNTFDDGKCCYAATMVGGLIV